VITNLTILAVEIGYVAGAAALTQSVRFVARSIARARTASEVRKMLRALPATATPPETFGGYRDNVAAAVESRRKPSPGFVERWRAKRAASYVHELERRAKIDT